MRCGFIDERVPVEIQSIFEAEQHVPGVANNNTLQHTFAFAHRFKTDRDVAALSFPWDLWYGHLL